MKKIILSLLAIILSYTPTLAVLTAGDNGPTNQDNLSISVNATSTTILIASDYSNKIPLYEGYQTTVTFTNTPGGTYNWDNFMLTTDYIMSSNDVNYYAGVSMRADDWGYHNGNTYNDIFPQFVIGNVAKNFSAGSQVGTTTGTAFWDTFITNCTGSLTVTATVDGPFLDLLITLTDGSTEDYLIYYPDAEKVPVDEFYLGANYSSLVINKIEYTQYNTTGAYSIKEIKEDATYDNWTLSNCTSFDETGEISIKKDQVTTVNFNLTTVGSGTIEAEIIDGAFLYASLVGNGTGWNCCDASNAYIPTVTSTTSTGGTLTTPTGEGTLEVAKIDYNNVKAVFTYYDGSTATFNIYYPYGNYVVSSFHMGGYDCSYTINSITFGDTDEDFGEEPTDTTIKEDTDYTTEGEGGWEITTESFNSNLTGLIAILENTQTNVYFTMTKVGLGGLQYDSFFLEMVEGGTYMSCRGDNALWGDASTTRYPNYNVDPAIGDYVASVAIVDDVYRVYVQTPEGIFEDFIWEGAFDNNSVSTFYMGGEQCAYTIKEITFTEINECNTAVSSKEVYTGTISENKTFDPVINIYGSYGYYNYASPVEFAITKGVTTKVSVTAQPFIQAANNWNNFVIETAPSANANAIPLRSDALALSAWNYENVTPSNTPSLSSVEKSWGDTDDDWTSYRTMCNTYPELSIEATVTSSKTVDFSVYWLDNEGSQVGYEIYTVTYSEGVPDDLAFHIGADGSIMTLTSVKFENIEPAVLSVISGNSSPTENPFVNCTKSELGTATITLGYEYKAIDETATITVTANYDGNTETVVGTITVAEPALTNGTIELSEEDILTALFGDTYGENPAVRLRDLTLLTFEGTFGSGITLTEATPAYTPDETFDVDVNTSFGGEDENEWEIRTIGVTNAEKSGEISLKDAYQTTIEYTLDKVGNSSAMLVEINDQNNSVVLYGSGFFTPSTTTGNAPTVSSSVSTGLITPSTGSATFAIAKVGGNTIEAVFTYDEESTVTFTIVYPDGYDAVESFYIGGSNCAYTVNSISFTETELTLTIIDTENDVENPFSEVESDEWSTVKILLSYEYSEDTETPSIAVSANYTDNTSGTTPLAGTITFGDDEPQFPTVSEEIEITQDMIFTALGISEDPSPSVTLGDFTLLTLTGKNGLLLTDWHWTYTPTTNDYATLDLIGNDATVFDGLSDAEIGTATVELILTNVESTAVELTVTATYGEETSELTGTITISDLVTASGIKTGSFTMDDIEKALTKEGSSVTAIDWSNVTALSLSVGDGDYKNVQLRGATVTSYTISSNKTYEDGWVLGCQAFNDNLTGKIAILSGQQTNIVFEMTTVGTQDQDDTFSLTLNDMLCEGNNTISGGETAVRYPNYNIDPVVGEYTLSIANVEGTYRVYVATPESIEDFVWEGTLASDASTFTTGGRWCAYTIKSITFTEIYECATAIENMTPYATGLIDEATTFSPVINVYGSYGFNSDGSGVTFPVTEGYTTSVNVMMRPFTRVNATPTVSDNYVIETIATESADGVTMLLGSATTYAVSSPVNTPTVTYDNLSEDVMEMCEAYTDLTIDASIVDEKTAEFVVTWNDDTDAETPAGEYTYTLTYSEGVPEELEFQVGADGAITTLTSVVFTEIIIEDENTGDDQKSDNDDQKTDDTTGGEDEGSTAIANVSVPVLEVARYNLLGQRIIAPQRGINIIVYSDGSTKKVLVK